MKRFVLMSLPMLCLATSAPGADLGPYPGETIERPAPPSVVERERIIEHHFYYAPPPVVAERRVYVEPRAYVYAPRAYVPDYYYPRPYAYGYAYAGRPYFFLRGGFWRGHHHHHW